MCRFHPLGKQLVNLNMYPNAKSIVWAQEEHYNGGAWGFMRDRIDTVLGQTHGPEMKVSYAGRHPSSAAATGIKKVHAAEEQDLIRSALSL